MIAFGLTVSLALLGMFQEETEVVLGESWTVEDTGYVISITVSQSLSQGMWNYYVLKLQFHNKAPRLMQLDKSKIYLVDNLGLPLFSPLDENKRVDELIFAARSLLGETIEAEIGRAVEELKPEKPVEIPPGAKVEIVTSFHTPLRPKYLLLSILGVSVGKDLLELQPVRIVLPDNSQ